MLNPPRTTGSPGVSTVRCREYPGVLALATLLAEVSKACWLTSSALKATESDPYNPDIASLLPAGESRRATCSGRRCKCRRREQCTRVRWRMRIVSASNSCCNCVEGEGVVGVSGEADSAGEIEGRRLDVCRNWSSSRLH